MAPRLTAVRAELRAMRWSPVLGAVLLAGALMVLDVTVWPNGPGTALAWLAAALLGGGACLALDDPSGDLTDTSPTTRRCRTGARGVAVLVPALAGWTAYTGVVARETGGSASWPALVLIGAALALAGFTSGALMRRAGTAEPGAVVAPGLLALVLGLMLVPLPGDLYPYDTSATWTDATVLWTVLATSCLLTAMGATADPWTGSARRLRSTSTGR